MSSLARYRQCLLNTYGRYIRLERSLSSSAVRRQQTVAATGEKSPDVEDVIIPKRISRSPTAVLDALASTVRRDFYSPPYVYIDDPETIPECLVDRKAYVLAKVSGQRAARYVMKRWPKNFDVNPIDPALEIPDIFKALTGPLAAADTEEGLRERIDLRLVTESFVSYQKNKQAGNDLSDDVVHNLLDLLCVYNSKDEECLLEEERLVTKTAASGSMDKIRNTWKDSGPAEEVFQDMKDPTLRACCSLIKGRAKYYQVDRAYELFRELEEKGMKPDIQTYNAIIIARSLMIHKAENKAEAIKELFQKIKGQGLSPTVETFNNAFVTMTYCSMADNYNAAVFVSSLLSEMYACGLEPTLATWYYIMRIVYRDNDCTSYALHEIMDHLEGKDLEAHHPDDLEFFSTAMVKVCVNLKDLELAYRIDNLLNYRNNYKLIGNHYLEGLYYNFYFKILCTFEQIDTIMEHYEKTVPYWFVPSFNSVHDLIEALELNEGYQYLPKIWTDMFSFRYNKQVKIMTPLCALLAKRKQNKSLQTQYRELVAGYYDIVKYDVMSLEERGDLDKLDSIRTVNAEELGYMCQVCLNSEDPQLARELFSFFLNYKQKIQGQYPEKTLESLVDQFIKEKNFQMCMCNLNDPFDADRQEALGLIYGLGYKSCGSYHGEDQITDGPDA
ncbi:hypothetical protein LSH36_39g08016 [Paralvinella palmiformis]|uniref:Small ribosomal subunit protein mS39 n=1 Tax=Paralvinella palmiformis TaxID=53620 RepID=A0AAD9K7T0_9ANNE|nr:hypothetical protein LSH36_39g08016 [Paralvinella palmiformis]